MMDILDNQASIIIMIVRGKPKAKPQMLNKNKTTQKPNYKNNR